MAQDARILVLLEDRVQFPASMGGWCFCLCTHLHLCAHTHVQTHILHIIKDKSLIVIELLDDYLKCFIVGTDNVGSKLICVFSRDSHVLMGI